MSVTLNDCDLAGIRDTVADTFDKVATWLTPDRAPDDMGGQSTTWREVEDELACKLVAQRLRFEVIQDRLVTITSAEVSMGTDAAVQMGDRLVIDGYVWHVDGVPILVTGSKTVGVTLVRP